MHVHYAVQTCDRTSWQINNRYCGTDKATLTKKSITSLLISIWYVHQRAKGFEHHVRIIDDNSSKETQQFFHDIAKLFTRDRITVEVVQTKNTGIKNSIKECYDWLAQEGKDFVYQIQDDYLFEPSAMYEIMGMFFQLKEQVDTEAVVIGFNNPICWGIDYANRPTPRTIFMGEKRYWIQIYDVACTFFTSKNQFMKHLDLYETFLNLLDKPLGELKELESISLNYMFTKRGVLGVCPIESLNLHIQDEQDKDPYIDWKLRWDNVPHIDDIKF